MDGWKGFVNSFLIRFSDIFFSLTGLVLLSPLFLFLSIAILFDSGWPVLFQQKRVGKHERDFILYKFRTMFATSEKGVPITIGNSDVRITKAGRLIRKFKLDELPQLLNVLRGDMSLVGPRPEVRKYVEMYPTYYRKIIFSVKPGITDHASIQYSLENELLSTAANPEKMYIEQVMPAKLKLNLIFIEHPTLINYLVIIWKTIAKVAKHR